jgi:uncharacterized iron-regulated membrane protein
VAAQVELARAAQLHRRSLRHAGQGARLELAQRARRLGADSTVLHGSHGRGEVGLRARAISRTGHTGEILGLPGQIAAGLGCLGGVMLVYTGFALSWRRFFGRRRNVPNLTVETLEESIAAVEVVRRPVAAPSAIHLWRQQFNSAELGNKP